MESVYNAVLHLNSQSRELYKCTVLLENKPISNQALVDECSEFIDSINVVMDIICKIIELQLGDFKKSGVCSDLLDALTTFLAHHKYIVLLSCIFACISVNLSVNVSGVESSVSIGISSFSDTL